MTDKQRALLRKWQHNYARYRQAKNESFSQPLGQSIWREWLKLYILQTIAMGAENGLREQRLCEFVHEERLYAIRVHNRRRNRDMHWKSDESAEEEWTNERLQELGL